MPRLPVRNDKPSSNEPKPPSIRIGGFELLVAMSVLIAWLAGVGIVARTLLVDVGCLDMRAPWRGEVGEMVVCALAAGPEGWLFLLYVAIVPLATGVWLRRKLSGALKC